MTNERLAEIEARLAAATPGPWLDHVDGWTVRDAFGSKVAATGPWMAGDAFQPAEVERQVGNQEFIAASWQDVADLLAEVKRLRGMVVIDPASAILVTASHSHLTGPAR